MAGRFFRCLAFVGVGLIGCSDSVTRPNAPADPEAGEALRSHWEAMQRRDWKAAYSGLHPSLKTAKFTLKRFTDIHARRPRGGGFPQGIRITGLERAGDDMVVSFDLLVVSEGGGEPVVSPRGRRAMLRKVGDQWRVMTSDILAAKP
jgi:hypothetical protein